MKLYPAIDLRKGQVVQLVGGDPNQVAVQAPRKPRDQAEHWKSLGAKQLHVVDLDGALGEGKQWMLLDQIRHVGLPVQFGGGVRSLLDIQLLAEQEIERIIVGTTGVQNREWLAIAAEEHPGRILLAVDGRDRRVVVKGWTEEANVDVVDLVASVQDLPLAGILYTNVAKEGQLQGIDAQIVEDICAASPEHEVIISGGITTVADLEAIEAAGAGGVVLGMSIYTDVLDFEELVERFEVDA